VAGRKLLAKKILFVVNAPEFFLSHSLSIAFSARMTVIFQNPNDHDGLLDIWRARA
jgi:hypothetical protein